MMRIHHLDCGLLESPLGPACCHCIALEVADGVALVDTGIGLLDCADPKHRLGHDLIDAAGFRFDEARTAVRQLEAIGIDRSRVTDIVLTHADPDHTGGLADFPEARIHVSSEELATLRAGHLRYRESHFEHHPRWEEHGATDEEWHGLRARSVRLSFGPTVKLIELFGHTDGHCGVAFERDDGWLLHVGDAYYLAAELDSPAHPVNTMAEAAAMNNQERLRSLEHLRRVRTELGDRLKMTGYHDTNELSAFRGG